MADLYNPTTKGSDYHNKEGTTASSYGYTIEKTVLTLHSGKQIEISNLINFIDIFESLNKAYSKVILQIVDASKFLEFADLRGDELIECIIKRTGNFEGKFNLKLKIAEINGYVKKDAPKQFFRLTCVPLFLYENQKLTISKSFEGTIGALINDICKILKLSAKEIDISTSSKEIIKGIYPQIKPLTAIKWLLRNAFDDGTPYFFYNTIASGIKLKSYKELLDVKYLVDQKEQDFKKEYKATFGQIVRGVGDEDFFKDEAIEVTSIGGGMHMSQFAAIGAGAYAGTVQSLDISTKELKVDRFNYDDLNNKIASEKPFVDEANNESDKSKTIYINTNKEAFDGKNNYHSPTKDKTVGNYHAYLENLKMNTFEINVAGDFNLTCGDIIKLKVISSSEDKNDVVDKYLTGKYLIKEIQHAFHERYVMKLTICRDSFERNSND